MHKRFAAIVSCSSFLVIGLGTRADADVRLDSKFIALLARPGAARHPLADGSGRIPLTVELPPGTDARTMGWQPFAPGLASLHVAPSELAAFEVAHPGFRFSIWPPLRPVLDQSAKLNGTIAYREALAATGSPLSGTGKGVVVGIIDTGLDVKHPDFLDASGKTRVAWLIDMSRPAQRTHPELETEFGCSDAMQTPCAIFDKSDIDAVFADPPGLLPRDPVGHGTHVASIAAGNGGGGSSARFVGGAPEATLIIAGVTHGSLEEVADTDIATGARFIFDRADALGMPAVINLSLGGDFGPHDGTTPLEKALAAMVGPDHPGHAIIVAAGNSGTLYRGDLPAQTMGIHTQTRVSRELPIRVPIMSPGVAGGADISGAVFVWATFEKTTDIAVGLEGPRGLSIEAVVAGHLGSFASEDNRFNAAIFNSVIQDEVPITPDTHGAVIAWDGTWPSGSEMVLRFEGEGFVDAWVQTVLNTSGEQAYFEVATRDGTINVPATHPDLIAVGCTVNRTSWIDSEGNAFDVGTAHHDLFGPVDSTCYFSSAGPTATGVMKPEISAPGALVAAAMSEEAAPAKGKESIFDAPEGICKAGNACLVVDPGHALLSGSSMSSPQVVGAVALLLERDPSLTEPEILRLLEQGARRPQGVVGADYQLGVGALDVAGAIAAYDARSAPVVRDPDAARSWMSLSESYAHPDARWSVGGTVLPRASDGSLADGFDPQRLSLQVSDGGDITEPLSRVDGGLWHFSVAGATDSGSRSMDIDVRFDGVSLGQAGTRLSGHRSFPIGADRWIAVGTARAYGGCAMANPTARAPVPVLVVVLVLVLARRRHRLSGPERQTRSGLPGSNTFRLL